MKFEVSNSLFSERGTRHPLHEFYVAFCTSRLQIWNFTGPYLTNNTSVSNINYTIKKRRRDKYRAASTVFGNNP